MVPTQTLENFPIFGDNATKVKPDDAKYAAGFQPADVYPAEWVNYVWNKSSSGITKANTGINMMEQEINNVLDGADKTPDATKNNQLLEAIQKLITDAETRAKLAAHPVGSLYWSKNSTDPSTLFGGTWARVKDKFILAAGDTYAQGATGGAATVTLDTTQIPSHSHTLNGHTHSVTAAGTISVTTNPTFTGSEHSHSYTPAGTVSNHSHGLNSHTHSVTAAGTVSSHSHGVGTIATGSGGGHSHQLLVYTGSDRSTFANTYPPNTVSGSIESNSHAFIPFGSSPNVFDTGESFTTASTTTNSAGYARYANWGAKRDNNYKREIVKTDGAHTHTMSGSTANAQPTFTGTAVTSGGATGSTANAQPTFTGTAATLKATQGGSISGGAYKFTGSAVTSGGNSGNTSSTGGSGAHNNMPPYVAYYCWERVS